MNLEQKRQRLAAISARFEELRGVENLTAEQIKEIDKLHAESITLTDEINAIERVNSVLSTTGASARKTAPTTVEVLPSKTEKNGGFKNFGEFMMSVKSSATGKVDPRFNNTMFEKNGEDGGFLVPEEMMTEISQKVQGDESLLSRATVVPVSGNSMSLPTDEEQPFTGGIQAYWTAEGAPITTSKERFGIASWRLHKLAAMVPVTDELLDDARALEAYIQMKAPVAMAYQINGAMLHGNGTGKPTGILNSSFTITVDKESGQSADTVVARNVIKMYNRMIPGSLPSSAWFINPQVRDQLRTMKDDQGNFIYLAAGSQLNQTPYDTLLGRPVIAMLGGLQALGDRGDIVFADWNYYYAIVKSSGIQNAISTHLYFDQDKTAYRFIFRIDGSCPFKAPVKTEFGGYEMSAFVVLQDR